MAKELKELLVIDDESRLCLALKTFFEEKGFKVTTAATCQAAMEQLHRVPAQVALLDLRLPDGSGLDVLTRIKKEHPEVRVVVISAVADSQSIDEALQRGASSYLTKPFDFDQCFFAAMGFETADVGTAVPDVEAVARVPKEVAQEQRIVPLRLTDGTLHVAVADPFDKAKVAALTARLGCPVVPVAILGGDLDEAIAYAYDASHAAAKPREPQWPVAPVRDAAEGDPAIHHLVSELIQHAHAARATDLHLGISAEGPWVRERIDGILYNVQPSPKLASDYASLVSHIKVMANLNVAEHRLPQEGRIWFEVGSTQLDLCLSILPTPSGEHIAIRLIGPSAMLRLEQLGLGKEQAHSLEGLLAKPSGLLIVCGTAGSGKSTSLYACLSKLNTGRVNVVTIEQTIEHELPGVTQLEIHPQAGLTCSGGIQSALRHDPNVLMISELTDAESASLAVGAASKGHLVLAGLHTQQAAGAITRLLDVGIEPFALCSSLTGILSQRLLRRLCDKCRTPSEVGAASLAAMGITPPGQAGTALTVWAAKGCKQCRGTGYNGRIGVFEFLTVDQHLRALILKRTSTAQLRQSAISKGMQSLWHSAWQKMHAGETSLEELTRVFAPELR